MAGRPDAALRSAKSIWRDLCDRRGFGLKCLESDDEEQYREILETFATIIRQEQADADDMDLYR